MGIKTITFKDIEDGGLPYLTHNENIFLISSLNNARILEFGLNTPPVSPSDYDMYISGETPTGDWAGKPGSAGWMFIALDDNWFAYQSKIGTIAFIDNENAQRRFNGSGWPQFPEFDNVFVDSDRLINEPTSLLTFSNFIDYSWSAGLFQGFELTDNLDGTVDIAEGEGLLRVNDSEMSRLQLVKVDAVSNLTLIDASVNYIYVDYNSGSPQVLTSSSIGDFNDKDTSILYKCSRDGTEIHSVSICCNNVDANAKIRQKLLEIGSPEYINGAISIEVGNRQIQTTAGLFYIALSKVTTPAFDTSGADTMDGYLRNGVGGWTKFTGITTVDNNYYDDGSGVPAAIGAGNFAVRWLFVSLSDGNSHLSYMLGQSSHATQTQAESEALPADFPAEIDAVGVLIAQIIVVYLATNFTAIYTTFRTPLQKQAPVVHDSLAGIDGGQPGEYFHYKQAEHADLLSLLDLVDGGSL